MKELVITLEIEDGSNASLINNAIKMIKGVKKIITNRVTSHEDDKIIAHKLAALDKLGGSVSMRKIDTEDERTRYLLSK